MVKRRIELERMVGDGFMKHSYFFNNLAAPIQYVI